MPELRKVLGVTESNVCHKGVHLTFPSNTNKYFVSSSVSAIVPSVHKEVNAQTLCRAL